MILQRFKGLTHCDGQQPLPVGLSDCRARGYDVCRTRQGLLGKCCCPIGYKARLPSWPGDGEGFLGSPNPQRKPGGLGIDSWTGSLVQSWSMRMSKWIDRLEKWKDCWYLVLITNLCQKWWHVVLFDDIWLYIIEGSLEVKLPTIWTDEKQSRAEAERRERLEERRVEEKE